ncbi:MAG: tripartite tricarboxylate transporter TctB family protein [Deltaproteobacteria bacterium]|nr:tripartite tricarboxylate transporter TctB family protein [Deltaproteobacteria bacterium]
MLINTLDSGFHLSARHRQAGVTTFYEIIKNISTVNFQMRGRSLLTRLWQWIRCGAAFSFSIAIMGVAVAIFSATQLGFGTKAEVGCGTFPFIVGVALAITGYLSGISSFRPEQKKPGLETQQPPRSFRRVAYTVITYFVWLLLTPHLGYIPATFAVTIAMAKIAGLEGWIRSIALSLSVTFFLYLLFEVLFYVDLPRGILG